MIRREGGETLPGELYVPNLMSFNNENIYIGSYRGVRFKLTPEIEESDILMEYWYGLLCYEKSTMAGLEKYPLTEEGILVMADRIEELAAELEAAK